MRISEENIKMQKKEYTGIEMEINVFASKEVIVASGTEDNASEVSTGPNDLPIMPAK